MKDNIANITKWILYLLVALVFLSGLLFYTNSISTGLFIDWAILLLIVGVIIMIISPIYGYISHPKNVVKLLISVALFIVVLIVGYTFAGNEFTDLRLEELKTTAETSKLVGMGLIVTYISLALAFIAVIYASIVKAFN